MESEQTDARLLWVAPAVASGGFALCVLVYAIPGALLLFVFASFIVVPIAFLAVVALTAYLARVYWPAALALVGACVVLYLLVAVPKPPLGVAATTATWLQLLVLRHDFDKGVAARNLGNKGSLVVLTVDGFVPAGSNGLVYDSSREIGRAADERTPLWNSVAGKTALGAGCSWSVVHLFGPYYSYSSSC